MSKLSKKQRQQLRKDGIIDLHGNFRGSFAIDSSIDPKTEGQTQAFEAWNDDQNIVLHGSAGTGKSFLGLYFGLSSVMDKNEEQTKLYIVRSAVSTREIGFQPGTKQEKEAVYEAAYPGIVNQIFRRGDAYETLKKQNKIEFISTSFLRSLTLDNAIIFADEVQNMNYHEISTIITRVGVNSRLILSGDTHQDDLACGRNKKDVSGISEIMEVIKLMDSIETINFTSDDIIRSEFVKSFILAEEKYLMNKT